MPSSIDHHKPDCRCPACHGRRQGGSGKFLVSLAPELAAWVREHGGPALLRELANMASAGQLVDRMSGEFPVEPHAGRSGLSPREVDARGVKLPF